MADCRSQFLTDDPTAEDFFGSREPLADAIADIITHTRGGKTIGLAGAWGSGKSSVIKALQEKLSARSDDHSYEVITFDAWAHEGDPLRRVFLERLERDLNGLGWVEGLTIGDSLSCRTGLSIKEEGIRLTGEGDIAFVALVVSVATLGFLGVVKSLTSVSEVVVLWAAAVAAMLTPLVMLVVYLREMRRAAVAHHGASLAIKSRRQDVLGLLVNKPTTIATTETKTTPDPTSVDFEDLFHGLLKEALADESRHLIMVVDNLDRIETQDARSVWSTMRTFLDTEHVSNEAHLARMWLIVPFARDGMARLITADEMVAAAALDKVFDLILEVAPPITSRWREYFFAQLSKALPEHAESADLHTIFRLYGAYSGDQWPMTPRACKRFVNKLVAIHHMWVHRIPLVSQALFVLINGEEVDLTNPAATPRAVQYLVGEEWPSHYAALRYGLEPDVALQAVVEPRITHALERGDSKTLAEIRSVPGFEILLETVLAKSIEDWTAAKPLTAFLAAAAIDEADLDSDDPAVAALWKRLAHFATSIHTWAGLGPEVVRGAAAVIHHSDDPAKVAAGVTRSLSMSSIDELGADIWYQAIVQLLNLSHDIPEAAAEILSSVTVPGDGGQYLTVLSLVDDTREAQLVANLRPAAAIDQVEAAALAALTEEPLSERTQRALTALVDAPTELDLETLILATSNRMEDPAQLSSDTTLGIARLLRAFWRADPTAVEDAVAGRVRDGWLSQRWWEAFTRDEHEAAAGLICLQLQIVATTMPLDEATWRGNARQVWDQLMSGEQEGLRVGVADIARESGFWLLDLLVAKDEALSHFAADLLRELLDDGSDVLDLFGWLAVVARYDAVAAVYGDEATAHYVINSAGQEATMAGGYKLEKSRLYYHAIRYGCVGPEFQEFVVTGMSNYSKQTWEDVIRRGTPSYSVLEFMVTAGKRELFGTPLADALRTFAVVVESTTPVLLSRLKVARAALIRGLRDDIDRLILDAMMNADTLGIRLLRSQWGVEISSSDIFSDEATRFLDEIACPLVDEGGLEDLDWLHKVLADHPAVLSTASGRAKRDLKAYAKHRMGLKRTGKNSRKILQSMVALLK